MFHVVIMLATMGVYRTLFVFSAIIVSYCAAADNNNLQSPVGGEIVATVPTCALSCMTTQVSISSLESMTSILIPPGG